MHLGSAGRQFGYVSTQLGSGAGTRGRSGCTAGDRFASFGGDGFTGARGGGRRVRGKSSWSSLGSPRHAPTSMSGQRRWPRVIGGCDRSAAESLSSLVASREGKSGARREKSGVRAGESNVQRSKSVVRGAKSFDRRGK